MTIALAGNPNSGKTTLFNALTGARQFVGNWPGVTVEKKEGSYRSDRSVRFIDLPGIYSLSPYSPEELVARSYLLQDRPDAILNVVDGSNLERNLYLTLQLLELGIPVVVAVNMMDVVEHSGDRIDLGRLSRELGCPVVGLSAVRGQGVEEAAQRAMECARIHVKPAMPMRFSPALERALAQIGEAALKDVHEEKRRWYAIKLLEGDEQVRGQLALSEDAAGQADQIAARCTEAMQDDPQSAITAERYKAIARMIQQSFKRGARAALSPSDRIDRVVTNRWLALPVFAVVMFLVYFLSVSTVGGMATDWVNEGVFGDGWHLLGIGSAAYQERLEAYEEAQVLAEAFEAAAAEAGITPEAAAQLSARAAFLDDNGQVERTRQVGLSDYLAALSVPEPDPAAQGIWVPGIPVLAERAMARLHVAGWLGDLVMNGIVAGVGAVLGFVPQILVLFLLLAALEACGYMARIAFILDRAFRRFGLSGKSFIPMLIGTGCSVPGIMASRTIESDRDRRLTIITTPFMPCSAKLPVIALFAGALFEGAWWVSPLAYFIGIAAIVVSGVILKKFRRFAGTPAPFVMELPSYHWPQPAGVLRSAWERGWSFIRRAGSIILLSTILIWFLSGYGFAPEGFGRVDRERSMLAAVGRLFAPLFAPLGWGFWQAAVGSVTGLVAKENVVGTFGVLYAGLEEVAENGWQIWPQVRSAFTPLAGFSFLVFNLLCAPCFAAIGATRREMNSAGWTLFAAGYQTCLAYGISLIIYQLGSLCQGGACSLSSAAAAALLLGMLILLFRPQPSRRAAGLALGRS